MYLCSLVFPDEFTTLFGTLQSVNGSSIDGGCTETSNTRITFSCRQGARNSAIFDGVVPTLTSQDLSGMSWARELFTIQSTFEIAALDLSVSGGLDVPVEAVEVVMFNCPDWGIFATTIRVTVMDQRPFRHEMQLPTSCSSLVSVCLPVSSSSLDFIDIEFVLDSNSEWVHLAEVRLFESGSSISPCQGTSQPFTPRQQTTGRYLANTCLYLRLAT